MITTMFHLPPQLTKWLSYKTILLLSLLSLAATAAVDTQRNDNDSTSSPSDLLTIPLPNTPIPLPLVGMGIGNLPHDLIPHVVHANLRPELDVRLIDTAHASRNERILGEAIASSPAVAGDGGSAKRSTRGGSAPPNDDPSPLPPIHIVTKVWYTHLNYERTKLSIRESLTELQAAFAATSTSHPDPRRIYVHMLLHWPRCDDSIPWMNCEEEENALPPSVRALGPPPHLDKRNAWKESWRAMEEVFDQYNVKRHGGESQRQPIIASIGVSNFELDDMKELMAMAKVKPQVYQGNAWKVFHDPYMMDFLRENDVVFQAYGVMQGILGRKNESPAAFGMLLTMAEEMREIANGQKLRNLPPVITEATVLLAYFVHSKIGIIPRASSSTHQHENSPASIAAVVPHLTPSHIRRLEIAIPALMRGQDVHASISFMNDLPGPIQVHWIHPETEEEVLVSTMVHSGAVEVMNTHPGHRFVAYDTERVVRREFVVEVGYGERQHFHVEL
ncbi:hypothetical protein ACHAXS_012645 [Conticribra weissflogii]